MFTSRLLALPRVTSPKKRIGPFPFTLMVLSPAVPVVAEPETVPDRVRVLIAWSFWKV